MAANTTGFQCPPGSWQWPDEVPAPSPTASKPRPTNSSTTPDQKTNPAGERDERHWGPRTCRICLETVLPTFHPPSENLPGLFQGSPSVVYESEGGRLIRPCKCKGSSRYVHESCLQEWRHSDPSYGRRSYWQCPTCHFQYRLAKMQWGRWISSKAAQLLLTLLIFWVAVFALGFVADPIINLYLDPYSTISGSSHAFDDIHFLDDVDDENPGWIEHFVKGFASLGLLGAIKAVITLGPWNWFQMRNAGILGGSSRGSTNGRDRVANISWVLVLVGVGTVLYAVWKGVRAWSRRVLEKASEHVMDVQGEADNEE